MALVLVAAAERARAQDGEPAEERDPHRLKWQPGWKRVGPAEYVATSLLGAGILALHWVEPATEEHWNGPILHDRWMRNQLRLSSRESRSRAATASDVLDFVGIGHVFLVDNLVVTALGDSNPDVAWQMFVINLQAYAMSSFANRLIKRLAQRARPYVEGCRLDPEADDRCGSASAYEAFYSGHATSTATSAGLICAHHTHLALYGGGFPDVATCVAAIGATTAAGALRIAADVHWATDVLVGHVSGYLGGYLLPTLLYYRDVRLEPVDRSGSTFRAMGFVLPRTDGVELGVGGVF
jgi:membrane-associated phospholipid phosphatase